MSTKRITKEEAIEIACEIRGFVYNTTNFGKEMIANFMLAVIGSQIVRG